MKWTRMPPRVEGCYMRGDGLRCRVYKVRRPLLHIGDREYELWCESELGTKSPIRGFKRCWWLGPIPDPKEATDAK